jgi:hypothetical protein
MVMSELQQLPSVQAPPHHWLAGGWLDDDVLRPLGEINARCIRLLRAQAESLSSHRGTGLLAPELRPLWASLDDESCLRLASCPYALVDVGFGDVERWRGVQQGAVHDLARVANSACFDVVVTQALLRQVLMYGWHLARAHRQLARIVFGMTPGVAHSVGTLSLQELERIAERYSHWLRPRWENRTQVWSQLLRGASGSGRAALQQATLHGLQLMAGGTLDRTGLAGTESRA